MRKQPGTGGGPPRAADARWKARGDMPTSSEKRELKEPRLENPTSMQTDDCRRTYKELSEKGVTFLSEPEERPYGIEATFRDDSGNMISLVQPLAFDPEAMGSS